MAISFDALRANYPTMPKEQFFKLLGGQWPSLLDDKMYRNTCAARLSYALHGAGVAIPAKYQEAIDATGASLIIKVKTMGELMNELFPVHWAMSKIEGSAIDMPASQGVIAYHVKWDNATGHFDLWTGKEFVGEGRLKDVADGYDIVLWSLN